MKTYRAIEIVLTFAALPFIIRFLDLNLLTVFSVFLAQLIFYGALILYLAFLVWMIILVRRGLAKTPSI
jgi:hypothetical protein